jgi:hypothetical protein
VNDGNGYFTDQSTSALTTTQLLSAYGSDGAMVDLNADGALDIVKVTRCANPTAVRALYNSPTEIGNFKGSGVSDFGSNSPTGVACGDLNHDALVDADLGFAGPGQMHLSLCGDDLTTAGSAATLSLTGAAANQPIFLPLALAANPVPLKGGTLVPNPIVLIVSGLVSSGSGTFEMPVAGAARASAHVTLKCIVKNAGVYEFSNALHAVIGY